ncbi:DNA replication and repair protein RecF [Thermanaeromonas toyohensis ToBE]|uniref:DNA replication and repair protein RecF n=1 Tax=Thermanaeromonas toyohensis ToBE TaxID=698762 RepID=A0A1W1V506_9FIRM|nr:DNA replication/repair protein RecF [Thermanaeromonas toyohensis]SMB88426.1 DNA replication and repair protein RecF [Thermanaeromonas toyohensis ToBE]
MQAVFLSELVLKDFRNFREAQVSFAPGLNILVGPNGTGKTNLLEAIGYLSLARSFRYHPDRELRSWGCEEFRIQGTVWRGSQKLQVDILYRPGQKELMINGNRQRLLDLLGLFLTVTFGPDDLYLVKGPPALRRKFLDRELCQIDRAYAQHLWAYHRVLLQRNAILKQVAAGKVPVGDVDPWNVQLITLALPIMERRRSFLERLNTLASYFYAHLAPKQNVRLIYSPSLPLGEDCLSKLTSSLEKEVAAGATLWGPQRDDFVFYLNGRPARHSASQGEQRSLVLVLKLAEVVYFSEVLGIRPCLLLDDVFSELDKKRQELLLKLLSEEGQSFITTTELASLPQEIVNKGKILAFPFR